MPLPTSLVVKKGSNTRSSSAGGMPAAGVADRDHHVIAGRDLALHARVAFVEEDVAGLERELAAIGHGIARVYCQIENGGGELIGIGQCSPRILGQ